MLINYPNPFNYWTLFHVRSAKIRTTTNLETPKGRKIEKNFTVPIKTKEWKSFQYVSSNHIYHVAFYIYWSTAVVSWIMKNTNTFSKSFGKSALCPCSLNKITESVIFFHSRFIFCLFKYKYQTHDQAYISYSHTTWLRNDVSIY